MADMIERICTIPLGEAYEKPRNKRTPKAIKIVRAYASRHMKVQEMDVSISTALNSFMWEKSIQKPPRKIKVKLVKEENGVKVMLADEKVEKSDKKAETKKDQKSDEKKTENKSSEKTEQKTEHKTEKVEHKSEKVSEDKKESSKHEHKDTNHKNEAEKKHESKEHEKSTQHKHEEKSEKSK